MFSVCSRQPPVTLLTAMAPAFTVLLLLSVSLLATPGLGEKCLHPPPAPQYSNTLYAGRWYEVGVKTVQSQSGYASATTGVDV